MKILPGRFLKAVGLLMLSTTLSGMSAQAAAPAEKAVARPTPQSAVIRPPTLKLINGLWFNGTDFVATTMYTEDGVFREKQPAKIDQTIDLGGKFVVPPFGDAHLHWTTGLGTAKFFSDVVTAALRAGEFYALDMGGIPMFSPYLNPLINQPTSVDYVSAEQRWTASGGHAPVIYAKVAKLGGIAMPADQLENRAYFLVSNEADIERDWPLFLASKPGIVKIDFFSSEEHHKRSDDPAYIGIRGINPKLAAEIVRRAHAAGLRTTAHVQNAADFHNALMAGVDAVGHIPLGEFTFATDPKTGQPIRSFATNQNFRFVIAEDDARYAGEHQIPVTTTLYRLGELQSTNPIVVKQMEQEVVLPNLRLLRKYNVPLVIGTDEIAALSGPNKVKVLFDEGIYLVSLGMFSPPEVLRMMTETTPQYIFPERKIGVLRDGYEASFLAYTGNPLTYLGGGATGFRTPGALAVRFKQGYPVTVPATKPSSPTGERK